MARRGRASTRFVFFLTCAAWAVHAATGPGQTPAMGWNSWNTFRSSINETVVRQVADAMVASGLAAAGFVYVNIDDGWMKERGPDGIIVADALRFPSGMKALGEYIHARGLKFGLYSDAGTKTCEGLPGSWGHEREDAQTYAYWGVDYLKYDFCSMDDASGKPLDTARGVYTRMASALLDTGRAILFSLCSWGVGEPWLWAAPVAHSWRTSRDVFAVWDEDDVIRLALPDYLQSVMSAVRSQAHLARFARPGAFNDPDMLVVGLQGMTPYGIVKRCPPHIPDCKPGEYISRERWGPVGGLTLDEQRSHFALWCMLAAPLILGNDPRSMDSETLAILTAREVIAVNQDPLGAQAVLVHQRGPAQVWRKLLSGCRMAFLLFNTGREPADVEVVWSRDFGAAADVCLQGGQGAGCDGWAASGECQKNPGFMLKTCADACKRVAEGRPSNSTPPSCGGAVLPGAGDWRAFARDLWRGADLGDLGYGFKAAALPPHASMLVSAKVTAVHASDSYGCGGEHLGRLSKPQVRRNADGSLTQIQVADPASPSFTGGSESPWPSTSPAETSPDFVAAPNAPAAPPGSARDENRLAPAPQSPGAGRGEAGRADALPAGAEDEKEVDDATFHLDAVAEQAEKVTDDANQDRGDSQGFREAGRSWSDRGQFVRHDLHALGEHSRIHGAMVHMFGRGTAPQSSGLLRIYGPFYALMCVLVLCVMCGGWATRRLRVPGRLTRTPVRSSRHHHR